MLLDNSKPLKLSVAKGRAVNVSFEVFPRASTIDKLEELNVVEL